MKRYHLLIVFALLLLRPSVPISVLAQTERVVDLYIQSEMKKRRIPGLALVIIKDGEIIKMQGYGVANLEHDAPVTPDTVFELASVTKQFTSTAIMLLVEEGKVKLDDPIIKYLPRSPRKWNGITVRHLLTHTAGLASLDDGFASLPGKMDYTTAELFKSATEDPMSFAPGANFQYDEVNSWGLTQGVAIRYLPGARPLPRAVSEKEALEAIEKAVEEKRRKLNIPGAALVIVRNDRVILQKGFGLRDVAAGLPVTPETLFPICSCTKTFTAMAAVISADEGKLSLDDSPKKYLPYFKLRDPEADAQVTLRDLLCHRTGLEEYGGDEAFQGGKRSREGAIRIGMQAKPAAKFREKWLYSNMMFLAAGEATAKAQNSTWEGVVSSRILKPLGMNASNFSVRAMGRTADFSWGYHNKDGKLVKFPALENVDSGAPAGAVNSNAKDMGQWLRLLLGGGSIDGKRLVSEKGFQEMLVKHIKVGDAQFGDAHYGLGLFVDELDRVSGRQLYFHPGSTDGFYAMFMFAPALKLGFAILTNGYDSALPYETAQIVFSNLLLARQL